jgi:hypothetical protein
MRNALLAQFSPRILCSAIRNFEERGNCSHGFLACSLAVFTIRSNSGFPPK